MSKKNKKPRHTKLPAVILRSSIKKLFQKESSLEATTKDVIAILKIRNTPESVRKILVKMVKDTFLEYNVENERFSLRGAPSKGGSSREDASLLTGIVDMTKSGAAYVVCEGHEKDIFVHPKAMNGALDGDTVKVKVGYLNKKGRPEGKVVEVTKRSANSFIGTIQISKEFAFVLPDKINMPVDIFVSLEDAKDAKDGDKVVVQVNQWQSARNKNPRGEVVFVLGAAGSSDIEMKSILINNGFNLAFPDAVIRESEALTDEITAEDLATRRDMRKVTTFTIDPLTAKDFDDALSIEFDEEGNTVIGVHIADVTHYVKPGTELDKEAYARSTSVYLVDRVLPMLPEEISNGLCSLRPKEDKFTFSAVFTFDKDDKIINKWFGKTLTHSNRRFTYEEAQERIETGKGDYVSEINVMQRIALKLRKQKFKEGAIAFESPEVVFELDDTGKPVGLHLKERKDAHMLVEDFMLLANKEVARYVATKDLTKPVPFVYRIHDSPDPDRVQDFANFADLLGYTVKSDTPKALAKSYNDLSALAKQDERFRVLEPLAIRTMAKAVYSPANIGHYGLGFDYYTHFTSPIRRYSDVLVHRVLFDNLEETKRYSENELLEQCNHISAQERKAMTAERESIKYKQVEYIQDYIGVEFEGRVNGFIDKGFFVELVDNYCEGLILFEQLDDVFEIGEGKLYAQGVHTGERLVMGDRVNVRVDSVDLRKRQIEFIYLDRPTKEEEA